MTREEILRNLCNEDPSEVFNFYALAVELMSAQKNEECEIILDKILLDFPEYLPIYYQAAAFFAQKGDFEKSKKIYEGGILLARDYGENKTLKELQSAYETFLFEYD